MNTENAVLAIDRIEQKFERLRERLAAVEAERDAQSALADQAVNLLAKMNNAYGSLIIDLAAVMNERDAAQAEAARIDTQLQASLLRHRKDNRELGSLLETERCKVTELTAERDAARAGEARAVEALKAVITASAELAEECDEDTWKVDETRMRNLHDVLDKYEPMIEENPPALSWLAQQRREAAVEALEKLVTDLRQDPWGTTLHDVDSLRKVLCARAAALRAGGRRV